VTYYARQLGNVQPLTREQVARLMEARERLGLRGRNPGCTQCGACLGPKAAAEPESGRDSAGFEERLIAALVKELKQE